MPSPEQPPSPKPPNLTAKQVPWGGARKPAAPTPVPEPPPPPPPAEPAPPAEAPTLTARLIPWGRAKKKPAEQLPPPPPSEAVSSPPPPPPSLTAKQVPWGGARKPAAPAPVPEPPPPPPPAEPAPPAEAPTLTARLIPWGRAKKKKPAEPPPPPPEPLPTPSIWALPKSEKPSSATPPGEPGSDVPRPEGESDNEPTAEQLVAFLTRAPMRSKHREQPAQTPVGVYKARPISFTASRWDVLKLWAQARRWRLSLAGVALVAVFATAYGMRLASLNAKLDRQLHGVEAMLRQRYAAVPTYLNCIASFGNEERFTFALTEKGLAAWRAARTEKEIAAAAAQMETALNLLAMVMNRYAQDGVTKEPEQDQSLHEFARLEIQRKLSRLRLSESIRTYDAAVEDFNDKVNGVPGSWVAWLAGVHVRSPLYATGRS